MVSGEICPTLFDGHAAVGAHVSAFPRGQRGQVSAAHTLVTRPGKLTKSELEHGHL